MAMTLITTNTSSNAASSSFTSGIDSTYKLYIFKFYDVNPVTDSTDFQFQVNASGQSGYNETMTTTYWKSAQSEGATVTNPTYQTSHDQAQATGYQNLAAGVGNGSDESAAGTMWLFNPSGTTFVKQFYAESSHYHGSNEAELCFAGGYINVTAAITNVQFKMASGNMDAVIKLYGVG